MYIIHNHYFALINLLVLLVLSAFFSGTETAFFSLTKHQLSKIKAQRTPRSKIIVHLIKLPSKLLVSILFGNLTVNILYFCGSTVLVIQLGDHYGRIMQVVFSLLALLVIILCGEIFPKAIGINYPVFMSKLFCYPIFIWQQISTPFRFIIDFVTCTVFPAKGALHSRDITADELKMLLALSEKEGQIAPQASEIIEDIITLSNIRIKSIMVPRVDMVQASFKTPISELIDLALKKNIYELSIYRNNKDNPIGFVNIKDLYFNAEQVLLYTENIIPAMFVPETKHAGELLSKMLLENIKSVYVVDEYGGLSGCITSSMILKELAGSFYYNPATSKSHNVEQLSESEYRLRGSFPLIAWQDFFDNSIDLPVSLNATSLGGLITFYLGRLPKEKDSITIENLTFIVEKMNGRRVDTVTLKIDNAGDSRL